MRAVQSGNHLCLSSASEPATELQRRRCLNAPLSNDSLTECFEGVIKERPSLGLEKRGSELPLWFVMRSWAEFQALQRVLPLPALPVSSSVPHGFPSFSQKTGRRRGRKGWLEKRAPQLRSPLEWPATPAPMADCDCEARSPLSLSLSSWEEKLLRVMALWQMLAKAVPCILKERHFWPQLMNHTYLLWHMPTICS